MPTQVASLYASIGADLSGLNRGLGQAQSKLKTAGQGMQKIGAGLTAGVTLPLVAIGKKVLGMGADFETSMARLSIASKGAAEESGIAFADWEKRMSETALAVGGDTRLLGVSASGAAESMTGLYKAGLSSVEMFGDLDGYLAGTSELGGAMRASIDLAAATTMDMVQASDLAAITLATFGGELKTDAERADFVTAAMDNLVKAADASVSEVDDLAQALTFVGSTAFDAGYSIGDTNNALAILSGAGLTAGRAGRNLQSMLASLQNPSSKAAEALQDLGIEIYDADGNMKKMPSIIGDFNKALAGLTQKERDAALGAIFTNAGIRAALPLLASGAEGWDDMAEATANATGIQDQAAAMADTLAGQWEGFLGTVETLGIKISKVVIPPLMNLVQNVLKPFIEKLLALNPNIITWGLVLAGVAAAAGPVLMILGTLVTIVGAIGAPLLLVVGAIVALGAAFLALNMDKIKGLFSGEYTLKDLVPPSVMMALAAFQGFLDNLGDWWAKHGPGIMETATKLFEKISEVVTDLTNNVLAWLVNQLNKFGLWFEENGPLIEEFWGVLAKAFGVIVEELGKAWTWMEPILSGIITVILGIAKAIMQMATGDWTGAWETIKETAGKAWEAIKETWNKFADWVSGWFGTTWANVVQGWKDNWEMFKLIVSTAWENIKTAISEKWTAIWDWITTKFEAAKAGWQTTWDSIKEIVSKTWENMKTAVATKVQEIKDSVIAKIEELFAEMGIDLDTFKADWSQIWEDVKEIAAELWSRITEKIQEKIDELKEWWGPKWEEFKTTVSEIWDGIKAAAILKYEEITTEIKDAIYALLSWWVPKWLEFKTKAAEIWTQIKQVAGEKFEEVKEKIKEKIEEIKTWITGQGDRFKEIGGGMIDGMKEGVKAAAGRLITSVKNAVEDALRWVQDKLHMDSPSKVFAGFGENMMKGWAQGIDAFAGLPTKMLGATVRHLVDTGETSMKAISPMGGGGAGGGGNVNIHLEFHEPILLSDSKAVDMLAERIAKRLKLGGGLGMTYTRGTA